MRSVWKGLITTKPFIFNFKNNFKQEDIKKIIYERNCSIIKPMLKSTVLIYNGKSFRSVRLQKDMLAHKLGEFSFTKKNPILNIKSKKKFRIK